MGVRSVRHGLQSNARAICTGGGAREDDRKQGSGQLQQVREHQQREARGNSAFDEDAASSGGSRNRVGS